jgi:hypothetical protein
MPDGGFTILELNGAVDFTQDSRPGGDIFREAALEIARAALEASTEDDPDPRLGEMSALSPQA